MAERIYIPQIQVRSKSLVHYYQAADPPTYHRFQFNKPTYSGTVTEHSRKRILRAVDIFLQKSKTRKVFNPVIGTQVNFRLNFITLTISARRLIDATEGHPALKIFLQHFKRPQAKKAISEQLRSYLWKAELQQRGQLHYHITTNSFLHFGEIQRVWNGIQFNRGWLIDFQREHGHTNPVASTDVHAVYKVKDIQAYLGKYLSKSGRKDVSEAGFSVPIYTPTVGGKVWDCSEDLRGSRFSMEMDNGTEANIHQALSERKIKRLDFDRCTIFESPNPLKHLSPAARALYDVWVN